MLKNLYQRFAFWRQSPFVAAQAAYDLASSRQERLLLTYQIVTRTWSDYKLQPKKMRDDIWENLVKRFTMVDLATPVATTIKNATYGGKVSRRIKKSTSSIEEIEDFKKRADYDSWIENLFYESCLYGTSFGEVGYRRGKPSLAMLPAISTEIVTPPDDVLDVQAIEVYFEEFTRQYTASGITDFPNDNREQGTVRTGTNFGFIPILIGRAKHLDSCSPYGEADAWPAVEEGKQITFLGNDTMILAKQQSFSTLIQKGNTLKNDNDCIGPFVMFKMSNDPGNDMKYISPDAKISELDNLQEKKYERCAMQCNVPVEVFTKANSGTNQAAGSALLMHKPLYDLALTRQKKWKHLEHYAHALIDARIQFENNNKQPVPFEEILQALDVEIVFENEANPALTQSDAQTYTTLVDANLITHEKAYWHMNPDGTPEEQQRLETERKERMSTDIALASGALDADPEEKPAEPAAA